MNFFGPQSRCSGIWFGFSSLVLREIEQEDTLWQQRKNKESKKEPTETKMEVTQNPEAKESPVPATPIVDEQTTKTQPKRKLNFFWISYRRD